MRSPWAASLKDNGNQTYSSGYEGGSRGMSSMLICSFSSSKCPTTRTPLEASKTIPPSFFGTLDSVL